jgi:transposase
MSVRLVNIDRETPMLFPVDLREWLPGNHLVHFVVDAVSVLDIGSFKINNTGSGDRQYPPEMMLALLIYCYATGTFGSRRIEAATYTDVAVRYICGNEAHPDHSVICAFRTDNRAAFEEAFKQILLMAQEMGQLKKVGGISVDGTKIHANASKHSAVSYQYAVEMIAEAEREVAELVAKAEGADTAPLEEGLKIPVEIARREDRKAKLEVAKKAMEERFEAVKQGQMAEREETAGKDGEPKNTAKKQKEKPLDEYQYNFTDPESRIMKAGNGQHFEQSYNAQAAVDTEGSMLILGAYVTNHGNDKRELPEIVGAVDEETREVSEVSADTGFYSGEAVAEVEREHEEGKQEGPVVYCAVEKTGHHKSVKDLEKKSNAGRPPANLTAKQKMERRLKTKKGRAVYKKRKETVEPVFGIIKQAMGFRQFLLRGLEKVNTEWKLVTLAYDFKKLYRLTYGMDLPKYLVTA